MGIGRSLLLAAAKSDALNRFATSSTVVRRATRAFMPGETMDDGLAAGAGIASRRAGKLPSSYRSSHTSPRVISDAWRDPTGSRRGLLRERGYPRVA